MPNKHNYRSACFDAKGEQCAKCSSEENVVAHHIDGDQSNNSLENLIPLCRGCHIKVHWGSDYENLHEQLNEGAKFTTDGDIDFEKTEKKVLYAREQTIHQFEDMVEVELESELRNRGYRDVSKAEKHDAVLQVVSMYAEQIADKLETARRQS